MAGPAPILIAFDGSDGARAAVATAAKLLGERPAVVLAVWEPVAATVAAARVAVPDSVIEGALVGLDEAAERAAAALAQEGATLARGGGLAAEPAVRQAGGNVWSTIIEAAEEHDAAAVVVGSRGRSGIRSALLGSVSTGVVHHCRRPVLVGRAG
jgi:nucleotide-binding universal stress UspA family protein